MVVAMSGEPIVVGVDGSPDSGRALEWAAEFGRRFEVPVHALAVWDLPQDFGFPMNFSEEDCTRLESQTRTMLQKTIREYLGEDSGVIEHVRRGHPAASLVKASEVAQLLVMGSRGHGAFVGMLVGSISQYCLHHATCPVVLMPSRPE